MNPRWILPRQKSQLETQNGITTLNTKTLDGNSFPIDTKINIQLIMDGEIRNSFGLIEESIVINN